MIIQKSRRFFFFCFLIVTACVVSYFSVFIHRELHRDCPGIENNFCPSKVAGFPVIFLVDSFSVSVVGHISFIEDEFLADAFFYNTLFYFIGDLVWKKYI